MTRFIRHIMIAVGATCALATGCASAGEVAAGDGGSAPTVTITSPSDNADVTVPFDLEFTSSEEIGPEKSGKHHVHVSLDGATDDYAVVTSSPFPIEDLPPGEHTVSVTLQHADHSPAGASAEITVNVTGSGGTPDDGEAPQEDYDYGY